MYSGIGIISTEEKTRPKEKKSRSFQIYKRGYLYDFIYLGFPGDLEFYMKHGKKGKVLYLGVGTGRIFGKLFEKNKNAFGLEISSSMRRELFKRYPNIPTKNVIKGNVLNIKSIKGKFDLIIAPYCFLNYFNSKETLKILKNVNFWLNSNGKFITDTFSPFTEVFPFINKDEKITLKTQYGTANINICYDHIKQKLTENTTLETAKGVESVILKNYYYYPSEFISLFEQSNFKKIKIFGNYKKKKLTLESKIMVFEVVKA